MLQTNRIIVLGNCNSWISDKIWEGITGAFGVAGENRNGITVEMIKNGGERVTDWI